MRDLRVPAATAAVVLLCAGLFYVDNRATSRPATSKADVNGIVDAKVGDAVEALQNEPPNSVSVYQAIVPPLVVIESQRSGDRDPSGLGSGVIVNVQGDIL